MMMNKQQNDKKIYILGKTLNIICKIIFILAIFAFIMSFSLSIIIYRVHDYMIWCEELHEATIAEFIYFKLDEATTARNLLATSTIISFISLFILVVSKLLTTYFSFLVECESFTTIKGSKKLLVTGIAGLSLSIITAIIENILLKSMYNAWNDSVYDFDKINRFTYNPIYTIIFSIICIILGFISYKVSKTLKLKKEELEDD